VKVDLKELAALAAALSPYIAPATVGIEHIIGALRGAGAMTDEEADDDLSALIGEALTAKEEADRAVRGEDPQ